MQRDPWVLRGKLYDVLEASDLRRGPAKARLFARATGRTLLIAAGTGSEFRRLSLGRVVAVDYSAAMLARASKRRARAAATIELVRADAHCLPFVDACFDSIITSCTLCSVTDPVAVLRELHRILRPGGRLLLFEHVRSGHVLLGAALSVMNLWTRLGGTSMTRRTLATVRAAGFELAHIESVYLDIIVAAEAIRRPSVLALPCREVGHER